MAKADSIEHTHIWATKYDDKNHWEYCTVCGEKRNVTAHAFTDHWNLGTESCKNNNYSRRICKCGYSYIYHKPHSGTHVTKSHTYWEIVHTNECSSCGDWLSQNRCYNENGPLNCKNPGTCSVCGGYYPSGRHNIYNGVCSTCGKKFYTTSAPVLSYSSDYSHAYVKFNVYPVDSSVVPVALQKAWHIAIGGGAGQRGYGTIVKNNDNSYTLTMDVTFLKNNEKANVKWVYDNIKINGVLCFVTNSFSVTVWRDHQAPVQNDVVQKDQASANGWATIKQLTLSGTEDFSDIVYLTVSDKATGEKYVTDAAVPVTGGKYLYTCTPSIEGDTNGRTYVVTAKDRIGNTSTKEFVVSKTDGSHPQLKSGTPLTYTDWSTSKNISLNFFDFGTGGVEASLDNQTDYKALTKSGEYYVWNHSFGNQVGTTEHTIYVRDALGNAGSYKLTVGNTDSNVYSITYNLNGGTMSGQKTSYTVADSFTLPQPTKTGYTFTGWTGSNGTTPQKTVTINKGTRGNLSYTANWSANSYTVSIKPNGGTLTKTDASISINTDGSANFYAKYDSGNYFQLGIVGSRNGYNFTGIYTAPTGGIKIYAADKNGYTHECAKDGTYWDSNNKWIYPNNVNFYAQWTPITWTVKYDANGGTGTMSDSKHVYKSGSKLSTMSFKRPGFSFTGWKYSKTLNSKTVWLYTNSDGSYVDGGLWYEEGKNPSGTRIAIGNDGAGFHAQTYIDGDVITAHAQWSYNPVSVKVPQVLTGDHTGKSQFRIKCDDLKAGNIKITVPNNFLYKQTGKTDVTAAITPKSSNNIITPSNKVCVYDITTKNGLSAGCWQGSFNIGLTLTKE